MTDELFTMQAQVDASQWEHPAPWWFKLAQKICPSRCREVPEAANPQRIVMRQVALWKRHVYLQQFAGPEDPRWAHSHQWKRTFAIGLSGWYLEHRPYELTSTWRRAPYAYTMDENVVHRVDAPSRDHCSIFIGLWRDDDLKYYHPTDMKSNPVPWHQHILKMVKRI